ncbi:hypothetical protein KC906_00580 [Candidatus Kaiserbacteria bacterium]|nr:hypothetical protein [Candidatus Kaiserbacteria bacterium]
MITVFVLLVGVVVFMGEPVGATFANNSSGEGIELTIDSYSIYNGDHQADLSWELKDLVPGVDKFFDFDDIKPGDTGLNTISVHLKKNPAYVCLDFLNLVDEENGTNEPESLVDVLAGGELSGGVEFFAWHDDGDNVFEVGETPLFGATPEAAVVVLNDTTYPLSDTTTQEAFQPGETYYVGMLWCAGDLDVDLATGAVACDATTLGNEYQTDSFTVDVSLRAVEATSYTNYRCEEPTVDLYLNKQISGVDLGFALSDFSYRITGEDTDIIAPHDSFTPLSPGTYTIEELVPEGFEKPNWRIGWYGQCESGNGFVTTITIEDRHLDWGTLYCEADNQYRPGDDNQSDPDNDDEGSDGDDLEDSDSDDLTKDDDPAPQPESRRPSRESRDQSWRVVEETRWGNWSLGNWRR